MSWLITAASPPSRLLTRNPFARSATDVEAVMAAQYRLLQAVAPRQPLTVVIPEPSASAPPFEHGVGLGLAPSPDIHVLADEVASLDIVAPEAEAQGRTSA